jgi:hypothetical protein
MKSNTITSTLGIVMILASGAAGIIDSLLLGGAGICGGMPLSWGLFGFAALTALLPAGAVGVFSGPWWLPALVYSAPLGFSVLGGALTGEWNRSIASIACLALAVGGAWLFRPRLNRGS